MECSSSSLTNIHVSDPVAIPVINRPNICCRLETTQMREPDVLSIPEHTMHGTLLGDLPVGRAGSKVQDDRKRRTSNASTTNQNAASGGN